MVKKYFVTLEVIELEEIVIEADSIEEAYKKAHFAEEYVGEVINIESEDGTERIVR